MTHVCGKGSAFTSPKGIFVGYKSYEIREIQPLFPFGHGLSCSTFKYSDLELTSPAHDGKFTVSFTITNVGVIDGGEVVQIYIADPESTLPRPRKELKGFVKVFVKAGDSERASVPLERDALSFYDERRGAWVAEAGKFDVLVAASSVDVRLEGRFELSKTIVWSGL